MIFHFKLTGFKMWSFHPENKRENKDYDYAIQEIYRHVTVNDLLPPLMRSSFEAGEEKTR